MFYRYAKQVHITNDDLQRFLLNQKQKQKNTSESTILRHNLHHSDPKNCVACDWMQGKKPDGQITLNRFKKLFWIDQYNKRFVHLKSS